MFFIPKLVCEVVSIRCITTFVECQAIMQYNGALFHLTNTWLYNGHMHTANCHAPFVNIIRYQLTCHYAL